MLTFFDGDDDFGDNEEDEYRCNSVNFQARTSTFCMKVCLNNSHNMMIMKMIIMIMVMMMIIMMIKLGSPDFAGN